MRETSRKNIRAIGTLKRQISHLQIIDLSELADLVAEADMCEPHDECELGLIEVVLPDQTWFLVVQQGARAVVIRMNAS